MVLTIVEWVGGRMADWLVGYTSASVKRVGPATAAISCYALKFNQSGTSSYTVQSEWVEGYIRGI